MDDLLGSLVPMTVNRDVLKILLHGICQRNAVSMSAWRERSGSFHNPVFRFGQGKIDSYYNRQPNSVGSNQERLHRKEE